MYKWICVCTNILQNIFVYDYKYAWLSICTYMYINMHVYTCVYLYVLNMCEYQYIFFYMYSTCVFLNIFVHIIYCKKSSYKDNSTILFMNMKKKEIWLSTEVMTNTKLKEIVSGFFWNYSNRYCIVIYTTDINTTGSDD